MYLTKEENETLEGKYGYPAQKSMELLVGLGECYDAQRMIPVNSSHLLYSISSLGKGGALFFQEMADKGGRFIIHTDTNPVSYDPRWCQDFGISEQLVQEQEAVVAAITKMGAFRSNTCAPYLIGNIPRMREHIAWNETSAVSFANSILGARTNREGGPSAFAAAIVGRVPEYGFHLDQNRCGDLEIVVTAQLQDAHDYGTLGYFTGKIAEDRIPVFIGIPPAVSWDALKVLGAAAATSGSVALYHAVGVTPEAPDKATAFGGKKTRDWPVFEFGPRELQETEESLSAAKARPVDLVIFGCPHVSITELRGIARLLSGKRLKPAVELWVGISRMVKAYGEMMGYIDIIEASGAKLICDSCALVTCQQVIKNKRPRTVATDSPKLANGIGVYAGSEQDVLVYYGSVERCVEAAITGLWRQ